MAVLVTAAAMTVLVILSALTPSPYLGLGPGPTPQVVVSGPDLAGGTGQWRALTIQASRLSWAQHLWAQLRGQDESVGGSVGDGAAMDASRAEAWAQAGELLGIASTSDVVVVHVEPTGTGAQLGLRPGDVIVGVDEVTGLDARSVAPLLSSGDELLVRRDGQELLVKLVHQPLGLQLADTAQPPPVDQELAGVEGPSAGLVLALAYLQARGGGDLTAGRVVAGTGTLDAQGRVGPVQGLGDKLSAARRDGVDVVLVPSVQGPVRHEGLEVVPVATLRDAVDYLCSTGGHGVVCS